MTKEIKQHLIELEKEKGIKILLAVESGSRAWGFPSPDSDFDIRIIYIQKSDWYLSINDKKDYIDYFHGNLLDINGWDIRKTLRLIRKSNATPFEWAQSPIVYFEEKGFKEELLELSKVYFQPYHTLNHYKGIAKNSYQKISSTGQIKLKKLFYVLRPLFAINWIENKMTIPPMNIFELMNSVENGQIIKKVKELVEIKENANEDYSYSIDSLLKEFINNEFKKLDKLKLEKEKEISDIDTLNNYFQQLLIKYDKDN